MFRNLLALLIAGQPVAPHRLFNLLRPRIKRQRSKQNRKIFILRLLFFVSPLRYTQSRGSARAKKKRLMQVVGKSIGKKGKESLFSKPLQLNAGVMGMGYPISRICKCHRHYCNCVAQAKLIHHKTINDFICTTSALFFYYALNVLNEDSTFLEITFLTASISVEIAFCSVSSCLSFNSKFLS